MSDKIANKITNFHVSNCIIGTLVVVQIKAIKSVEWTSLMMLSGKTKTLTQLINWLCSVTREMQTQPFCVGVV